MSAVETEGKILTPGLKGALGFTLVCITTLFPLHVNGDAAAQQTEAASDVYLDLIREAVENNFEQVKSLKLDVRIEIPNILTITSGRRPEDTKATRSNKTQVREFTWAFQSDGKEYLSAESEHFLGESRDEGTYLKVFNGEEFRFYNTNVSPPQGYMLPVSEAERDMTMRAAQSTLAGMAWGRRINTRSLRDWLSQEEASIIGTSEVEEQECTVVEIPYTLDSDAATPRMKKLYLVEDKNFALARIETYRDGEMDARFTSTNLKEIVPGVWFPLSGIFDNDGKTIDGVKADPTTFEVTNLDVNIDLPQELFNVEFPDGTFIIDRRAGGELMYTLGQAQAAREFLKELDVEISASFTDETGDLADSEQVTIQQPTLGVDFDNELGKDSTKRTGLVVALIVSSGLFCSIVVARRIF